MKSLLTSRWLWPVAASPLLLIGVLVLVGGGVHRFVAGASLVLGWGLTVPFGAAERRWRANPTPTLQLAAAGWALLVLAVMLGGLWWGMSLDPEA
ncbi:hypothetical protein [Cellulomonas sp. IC4_254]|uniref:hypothetical protein n=1 Tax=Cellulomonas sp. IC4_254 TaxID=2714040 RepID=UPI00141E72D2|nr:hypothetical protein [Cellulomonas sp. IC4_254]NHT18495.1 hypothetical protein [Cellulomonas sp. IC4_254]